MRAADIAPATASRPVTLQTLLQDLIDRDRLARFPDPTYTTAQASSYDRQSVAPNKPGWFANRDAGNFIRTETTAGRQENVLLDTDGPGVVTRIYMAAARPAQGPEGVLRI